MAQAIPVRREALDLVVTSLSREELAEQEALRLSLQEETGVYRKRFRQG